MNYSTEALMTTKKFVLTERDIQVIYALNDYRYLNTSQIHRLLFSTNKTMQSARRRLSYLFHAKYIGRATSYAQPGNGSSDLIYFLDSNGNRLLKGMNIKISSSKKTKKVKHLFMQHALELSEFRIKLTQGADQLSNLYIEKFIPDFQLKSNILKISGMHRYLLFRQITHPITQKKYVVYPDAAIVLNSHDIRRLFFLEIDRGTEGLTYIKDKLIGYNLYFKSDLYQEHGDFSKFTILFQTTSHKRAKNMRQTLLEVQGEHSVRIAVKEDITKQSLLLGKVWLTHTNDYRSIIKANTGQSA